MLLFDEYIKCVHKMPGGEDMEKEEIRKLLFLFARSVERNIESGSPWNPPEDINLEQVINLGFIKKDNNNGELTITELGKRMRQTMGWIYASYDTTL